MRILVTGGAGFIGSALVRRLVAGGADVLTYDKLTYAGHTDNLAEVIDHPRHRFRQADICDRPALAGAFAEFRPDAVMHLAAETHVDRSIEAPAGFVETNVVGTAGLLDAALAYWRALDQQGRANFPFLSVSTDEVFGALGPTGAFDESSPYRPNSPYAASKAAADHLARAYHRTYGLPVLITNSGNNYGPYQFPEKLVPLVILNALDGRPLPVYGAGANVRDWIHVNDHAAALELILTKGRVGESYLVGARAERTNLDLVRAICQILDRQVASAAHRPHESLLKFVADRPGHDARYALDPAKLEGELAWRAQYSLEIGLGDTVAWYMANRAWCRRASEAYDRRRLGLRPAVGIRR